MSETNLSEPVARLVPHGGTETRPLKGLYLNAELPDQGRAGPWVYTNFVTTLDGRISLVDPRTGLEGVPETIGDPRDWRLFQELACRADVLIASGRYLRNLQAGTAQDVLPLGDSPAFADLLAWRHARKLPPQPDVAVVSGSLNFNIPSLFLDQGRRIIVLTTDNAPSERASRLEDAGAIVIRVNGGERVSGLGVVRALGAMGYQRVYAVAGPQVFHTLVDDDVLDTLFLTWRHRIVGGTGSTFIAGPTLRPPTDLAMRWLYQDLASASAGQCFARFDSR
ncbi:MAG: dihydrofolate reductase family protein [Aquisalimonadaceae bacterium]